MTLTISMKYEKVSHSILLNVYRNFFFVIQNVMHDLLLILNLKIIKILRKEKL